MTQKQVKFLFLFSLIGILATYFIFLGSFKTFTIISNEYIFILLVLLLWFIGIYLKQKLKEVDIIDFHKQGNITLRTTILFFLFFQVVDYIYENGFIGMISQWFVYWIMGYFAFMLLNVINYYKNIKYQKALQ